MEDSGLGGGEWAFILIVLGVAVAIGIIINAIVCWLTSSALSSVPSEHREMEPGLVWLLLIPCFGVFWSFFVFPKVARSFRRAFEARGETRHGDCGVAIGWWIAICAVLGIVPCVNYAAGPAYLILLILFLVKIHGFKQELSNSGPPVFPNA